MARDPHDDSRLGRILDERYRIDSPIGRGGMGVIYLGERIGIGKKVAIKFLHRHAAVDPEHRKRFEREAEAMSRVTHPNLVSVIDHGISEGMPYLVMEYHQGETLGDVIERGAVPPRRAVGIARQIASGIQSVHAAGIVHRDLKPDNVILLADVDRDFAKILDFGIAKIIDASGEKDMTSAGMAIGTPAYMSPEQAYGSPLDGRADLYAIGVILFEMVCGKQPFVADENLAVLRMQAEDPPPRPRHFGEGAAITQQLEAVILRTMSKDASERYANASEFVKALDETPEGSEVKTEVRVVTVIAPAERASTDDDDDDDRVAQPSRGGGFLRGVVILIVGVAIGWVLHDPRVMAKFRGAAPADAAIDAPVDARPLDAAIDAAIDARPPDASIDAAIDAAPADATLGDADQPADGATVPP